MNCYTSLMFFAAIIAGLRSGSAIRCYVCNSAEDFEGERCDYVPEDGKGYEDLVYDCDSLPEELGRSEVRNYTLCRKFVQDVDGDYRVVRSCATSGRVGQCVDRTGTSKIKLRYCECQNKSPDEPCNGSLHSAPPMSLWMSVLAAATFVITAMHA